MEDEDPSAALLQGYRDAAAERGVPEHLIEGLAHHIVHGSPTGSFLEAVLSNDLRRSFERGDSESLAGLGRIVTFLYNDAPRRCWGSLEAIERWSGRGGLK